MSIQSNDIELFKSLFKGREDVFATRWEKGSKSGYMPAYHLDPYRYRMHKMKGGTFKDYEEKTYLPLSDEQIVKHLEGEQLIGLYPLLKDNTSWFLAADFDEANWEEECRKFIAVCAEKNIPAYLERSRSGNGGHVWIFFQESYPAVKSRKIVISLLEQSGAFSVFDKNSSFDRLFPNQDFHSGKGLGNLIALPLYKHSLKQGNSCFIDIETLNPMENQWGFLKNINRVSVDELDKLYESLALGKSITYPFAPEKLTIRLNSVIKISRFNLPIELVNFLKEELNFTNTEFFVKKKSGRNTWDTSKYFRFIEEVESEVIIPRGMIGKLVRYCKEHNIDNEFIDERRKNDFVHFSFNIPLKEYQIPVVEATSKKDFGVIVAPPGAGKTVMALKIIADRQQSALIVVHRKQLLEQWVERIESFLNIPKKEIGKIGQGKIKIGKHITIATFQSLGKVQEKEVFNITDAFGTIIIDECHHIPAETFKTAISKLNSHYVYGLTATPFRKYNDGKLIFIHLGEVVSEIKPEAIVARKHPKIIIRTTDLNVPFNPKTDRFETLSKILVHDSARNKLILDDVISEVSKGKKAVIITERKDHIDTLQQFLKQSHETITLSGDDSEAMRKTKWQALKNGNFQVLISTGQFFGEGSDLHNIECLFLVYPFSFEGKLVQYIGRVQRSEITPIIYDYRDFKIEYLDKLFLKRNTHYRKLQRELTLFDDPDENNGTLNNTFKINENVRIPMELLEFRYGMAAFKYSTEQGNELLFEIENDEIRPEFEVLKPYFTKVLKSNSIKVFIQAEIENGKIISQLATSDDINRINQTVIEGVKFRFFSKIVLGKSYTSFEKGSLLDLGQLQTGVNESLGIYTTERDLLEEALKAKGVRHAKELLYLADRHDNFLLKIRFVLTPFSFVFLLTGAEQYHIVMETLDTEEATYIWHSDKKARTIQEALLKTDRDLSFIRNHGRQLFLEQQPKNFSRILHDYSDQRKGFMIWKSLLEEQLI